MRKFICRSLLTVFSTTLFICAVSFFIINACRKIDRSANATENESVIHRNFFAIPAGTNRIIKVIAQSIQRQDQQRHFIPELTKKAGYPRWDKAMIAPVSETNATTRMQAVPGEVVLIPFVKENERVTTAILIINTAERDTAYHLIYASRYEDFGFNYRDTTKWNARNIFHLFSSFDNEIFGYAEFWVKDLRILTGNLADTSVVVKVTMIDGDEGMITNKSISLTYCNSYENCAPCSSSRPDSKSIPCQCGAVYSTVCTTVWMNIGGAGGSGGGGSGGGGGGGSNWENENPCKVIPEINDPCNGSGSGGWDPVNSPQYPPIGPVDSILAKTSVVVNLQSDSLLAVSLSNHNSEYSVTIVMKDGVIYTKNVHTENDSMGLRPDLRLAPGEVLLGYFHTHPRANILDRSAPSHGDIDNLRLTITENFISYIECGNVRYALVVEDVVKAKAFFRTHNANKLGNSIYTIALQQPNWFINWQNATQVAVTAVLGSASANGIGFYISNNLPKTTYTKLNP